MTNWDRFEHGQLIARVDGGPAGVYYCETVDQYSEAILSIIMHKGTGLYNVSYLTHEGKEVDGDRTTESKT